ncbi:MAG: 23S rRNA (adenine(2030)-N(6))-methyltransferase RlmJ [Pseudomonadota bacterium]
MLSYQHAYHAGNLADVHKHALLAIILQYLVQKPKPLSYFETHAGRALYDLTAREAQKTKEADAGILKALDWFSGDHPYRLCVNKTRDAHGASAYPGSPLIASALLRPEDTITLAELHPQEVQALRQALPKAKVQQADGPAMVLSMVPPIPRRGVALIDPSYEVKSEWKSTAKLLQNLHRKWPVGVLMVWYPVLATGLEAAFVHALPSLPADKLLHHTVQFPPARDGHRMVGSGMVVVNPPWGLADQAKELSAQFARL